MTNPRDDLMALAQELLDWYTSGILKQDGAFIRYVNSLTDIPKNARLRVAENNIHNEALRLAASRPATQVVDREVVARALCESGKFETGEGTCSLLCMDQLGGVRKKGCNHLTRVHGKLVDSILSLLRPAEPVEAEGVGEPVAWRIRVRNGPHTYNEYTERLPFEPLVGSPVKVLGEPESLYTHPPKSPDMIELLKLAYDNMFDGEAREQVRRKLFE